MNIIGTWNKHKIPGEHEISWPFGTLDLDISNNVTVIENKSTKLVYEGTVFNRTPEELISNQADLDNAYGLYSYVKVKKNEQEIIIGTDKLGFSPIYYSIQNDALVFSTSLTLLKYGIKNPSPDYEAWDEILNLGDILGEKTTINEIKRLNPGTRVHIKNGKFIFEVFWSPEIPDQVDENSYIKSNNELLVEALELTRNTQNSKIVLLSGGEDSRRIAVTAHSIKLPIALTTQETISSEGMDKDAIIAEKVADCLNIPLNITSLPSVDYSYHSTQTRDYWMGFETSQHEWILPLLENIPINSLLYDGVVGDVTINGHYFRKHPALVDNYRDVNRMAKIIYNRKNLYKIRSTKLNSSLYDRVTYQLRKFPECPQRVNYYYVMNHTRRNIGLLTQLFSLMGHKACCPYIYYPLFIQSLSLDPKYYLDKRYQHKCMEYLNPKVAKIPSTRDDVNSELVKVHYKEAKDRECLFSRIVVLGPEVKRLFPHLRTRFLIYDFASLLGMTKITSRLNWQISPLSRMNSFFDWLQNSNQPSFPVCAEEPVFLGRDFIV